MLFLICGTTSAFNGLFLVFADVLRQLPLCFEKILWPQLSGSGQAVKRDEAKRKAK